MGRLSFSTGMLGVVTVTLALAFALLGSWALSTDVTEREVTVFNPLADVTPLFEGTMAPEYIDYSPSTNYTGYYTDETIVNGTIYFGGVDYTESNSVNQFRVKLPPSDSETDQYTMQDSYTTAGRTYDAEGTRFIYQYAPGQNQSTYTHTYSYSIRDLAQALGYSGQYLTITSTNTPTDWSDPDDRFVDFVPIYKTVTNVADERVAYVYNPEYTIPSDDPAIKYRIYPILGCVYDQVANIVSLYYDTDLTKIAYAGMAATDVYIWFDDLGEDYLDNKITVVAETLQPTKYMDPSKGVELA